MANEIVCDVAVIGAGTAGLSAERGARAEGARTVLIDPAFIGTLCANHGCMPSKLLIAAANRAKAVRSAGDFGLHVPPLAVEGAAVMERLHRLRDDFVTGTQASFDALPEGAAIKAHARFAAPTTLALNDGRTVEARAVVIATGSVPHVPKPFDDLGALALTNRTIFELDRLPRSLAVIGAGPLGIELGQAMSRLGVEVTVFDRGHAIGSIPDETVHGVVKELLADELALRLGVETDPQIDDAGVRIAWSGQSDGEAVFERVLVATGRPPDLRGLDLKAARLPVDEHGTPVFDRRTMQCGDAPVFIAGDADADAPVLHEASDEGTIAGRNAARYPNHAEARRAVPFSLMFTDPPVAVIGDVSSADSVIGCSDYSDQGRARVEGDAKGLAKIHGDPRDGRIVGAVLACPGADHLSHLLAWAITRGDTATALLELPFYHPTLEEGLKSALRQICAGTPTLLPKDRDSRDAPGA